MDGFKRALVTGGSGFIGQHLVNRLIDNGVQTRCLARPSSDMSAMDGRPLEIVRGHLTDSESLTAAMANVDVVFHLAGLTKTLRRNALWDVNESGTAAIAKAASNAAQPPAVVVVSSLAAAGPNPIDPETGQARCRRESDSESPVSDYGKSKLAGDVAARKLADRIPLSLVRPPIVLGQGDRDGFELFKSIAKSGIHLVPGWRAGQFSIVHVEDLVDVLIAVANNGERCHPDHADGSGVYFAADEQVVDYAQLGNMVAKSLGREDQVHCPRVPPAIVRVAAAANQWIGRVKGRPHIFGWDKAREALATGWACEVNKCRRDLAIRFPLDLQSRLNQTAAWYRGAGWL